MTPNELRYTSAHEWIRELGGGNVRVGITDYAQRQLGDVVFVQLPAVGERADVGKALGEVESTKSVSDIYAPLSGEVVSVNQALDSNPELVNTDPYDTGWMFELRLDEAAGSEVSELLDATAYRALTDGL